jgi:aspartate dehydrogenase
MDFVLVGHGAIARHVLKSLAADEAARCMGLVVRPARLAETRSAVPGLRVEASIATFAGALPGLVVECAGHGGLAAHGVAALEAGADLLVVSVGALADAALFQRLKDAAARGRAKLLILPGAVGGIDALAAARQGGLAAVRYTSRKPPAAWKGTQGERAADLDRLAAPAVLFEGRADEAARLFPQNANVAATIALAGAGFERTAVRLVADPAAPGNVHEIEAEGAFGAMRLEFRGRPLPDNPKTSSLTAFSVLRALRNRAGAVEI